MRFLQSQSTTDFLFHVLKAFDFLSIVCKLMFYSTEIFTFRIQTKWVHRTKLKHQTLDMPSNGWQFFYFVTANKTLKLLLAKPLARKDLRQFQVFITNSNKIFIGQNDIKVFFSENLKMFNNFGWRNSWNRFFFVHFVSFRIYFVGADSIKLKKLDIFEV